MRNMFNKVPLAWLNLTHNIKSLIIALLVLAFAVFLIFIQLGFRQALLDSNVEFIRQIDTDLILVSQRRYTSFMEQTFSKQRLYQIQGFEGIKEAYPLYISTAIWKNKENNNERPIRVFGYPPESLSIFMPSLQEYAPLLQLKDTVLADQKSRHEFGKLTTGKETELEGRKIKVVGTFELGTDFVADGNLMVSDQNFLRLFVNRPSGVEANIRKSLDQVDLGLLKINSYYSSKALIKALKKVLPPDIEILTKEAFIQRELNYWNQSTPIGFMFGLGTVIGFVVGTIVVYNILYTDIHENLPQYATLKTMGYPNSYLSKLMLQQGVILAVLGFFPGWCISVLSYEIIGEVTGLIMQMNRLMIMLVFCITFMMCILSGILAIRKLKRVEPVEVFDHIV